MPEHVQSRGVCEIAEWLSVECTLYNTNSLISDLTDLSKSKFPDGNFGVGNGHWTLVTGDYVFICFEYGRPDPVLMTVEQALSILKQYKLFLDQNHKKRHPPNPFNIEYFLEGQEAINYYNSLDGTHGSPFDVDE